MLCRRVLGGGRGGGRTLVRLLIVTGGLVLHGYYSHVGDRVLTFLAVSEAWLMVVLRRLRLQACYMTGESFPYTMQQGGSSLRSTVGNNRRFKITCLHRPNYIFGITGMQ